MKRFFKLIRFSTLRLLGYKYIVNHRSWEIHLLGFKHTNFDILQIKDYSFVRNNKQLKKDYPDYNGCRFCLPEMDTDKLK